MTTLAQQLHNSATHTQDGPDANCPVCNPTNFKEGTQRTIDITPRGLTTPEGIARVNNATREFESSAAELANAAIQFFNQYEEHILHCMEMYEGVKDDVTEIRALIDARLEKQEAFLRALAGQ